VFVAVIGIVKTSHIQSLVSAEAYQVCMCYWLHDF